ncbi:MAG: hypothetical protein HN919_00455 [Verrucomicrobia bacterium]|jgi:hypothetical protein|nr:hypothetical protein [Verrucomicrobiota bacterium]MBT7064748.1 hypothetical protein [Verrucomicrobiota bacterium]MBT7699172.1 hypothetical protein [Verrucomicrobiota bacterium]
MKWMEIVRVMSSADDDRAALIEEVTNQLAEIMEAYVDANTMLLQHALYEGDLAAVLAWDNDREPVRSREGLMLAQNLQRHGAIDHAVWRAAPGFERQVQACADKSQVAQKGSS